MTVEQLDKALQELSFAQAQVSSMLQTFTKLQIDAKEYDWARNNLYFVNRKLGKLFAELGDLEDDFAEELDKQSNGQDNA